MSNYKEYEAQSIDLLQQAADEHPGTIYQLSSFAEFSVAGLQLVKDAGLDIPVLHNNTGDLHDETLAYRDRLRDLFDLTVVEIGPSSATIQYINNTRLELDPARSTELQNLTKARPLANGIRRLGITALISGIRRDQPGREHIELRGKGINGEERYHPLAFWPEDVVLGYIREKHLPRHPFNSAGIFKSIGGKHSTFVGTTRFEQRGYENCPLQAGVA